MAIRGRFSGYFARILFVLAAVLTIIPPPAVSHAVAVPQDNHEIHVLNRLGFGPRPGDIERVKKIGVERYIQEQLNPRSIPIPEPLGSNRIAELLYRGSKI